MIVRPRLDWWRMLFVLRGSVLVDIAPQMFYLTALAVAVTVWHGEIFDWKIPLTFVPFSLIGLTLAIFLGFRNSTSYARFWEARTLWGSILNDTRTATRQALTLVDDADAALVRPLVYRLIAFSHALRHQLRGTDLTGDVARLLPPDEQARIAGVRHKASHLLLLAGEWLRDRRRDGSLAAPLAPALDASLDRLTSHLGGCERIANTPIPFTYSVIIHRTIYLYCVLLPFGLVDSIGPMTPVVVAVMAYTFLALEALGAQLEEPFGRKPNDLALESLCAQIESSLRDMLGERDLPEPPRPDRYVLV